MTFSIESPASTSSVIVFPVSVLTKICIAAAGDTIPSDKIVTQVILQNQCGMRSTTTVGERYFRFLYAAACFCNLLDRAFSWTSSSRCFWNI
ncbi:hypothetical protein RE6C_03112 [Rhodopirellula europaea 6C]|uniref:Uncharacterized protein n=1 Tax=Rhodopirellula europaea 6C TaxID=1263867 RepID=M2B1R8_9BACT|nr:hypothetical protein RE6C_03112 [Rhodopirellula europaea 6C]